MLGSGEENQFLGKESLKVFVSSQQVPKTPEMGEKFPADAKGMEKKLQLKEVLFCRFIVENSKREDFANQRSL